MAKPTLTQLAEQGELVVHRLYDLLAGVVLKTTKTLAPPRIAVRINIDALAARLPAIHAPAPSRRSHCLSS